MFYHIYLGVTSLCLTLGLPRWEGEQCAENALARSEIALAPALAVLHVGDAETRLRVSLFASRVTSTIPTTSTAQASLDINNDNGIQ